jgi:hypothetical protein
VWPMLWPYHTPALLSMHVGLLPGWLAPASIVGVRGARRNELVPVQRKGCACSRGG